MQKRTIINQKKQRNYRLKTGVPIHDALHAILARDNIAILVTRDKHFEELRDLVEIKSPEEVISS